MADANSELPNPGPGFSRAPSSSDFVRRQLPALSPAEIRQREVERIAEERTFRMAFDNADPGETWPDISIVAFELAEAFIAERDKRRGDFKKEEAREECDTGSMFRDVAHDAREECFDAFSWVLDTARGGGLSPESIMRMTRARVIASQQPPTTAQTKEKENG